MLTQTNKSVFPRVLLADDHQAILDTESRILAPEFHIVGAVRDGAAVLAAAAELDPDVITLDITMPEISGLEVARRLSPKRAQALDLFRELVYFTQVFPHRNLWLETAIVEVEEIRFPGHGRRRRWRDSDFQIADQRLVAIESVRRFRKAADLLSLLPSELPSPFDTSDLARDLAIDRAFAQQIAYCLRRTGAVREIGKAGNARLRAMASSERCSRAPAEFTPLAPVCTSTAASSPPASHPSRSERRSCR